MLTSTLKSFEEQEHEHLSMASVHLAVVVVKQIVEPKVIVAVDEAFVEVESRFDYPEFVIVEYREIVSVDFEGFCRDDDSEFGFDFDFD